MCCLVLALALAYLKHPNQLATGSTSCAVQLVLYEGFTYSSTVERMYFIWEVGSSNYRGY